MQLSGQYGPAGGIAVNANAKVTIVKIDKSMDE
jgi:hypothetical protein